MPPFSSSLVRPGRVAAVMRLPAPSARSMHAGLSASCTGEEEDKSDVGASVSDDCVI